MRPTTADGRPVSLTVFFPAYYDELNIPKVVTGALQVVGELGIEDHEIIIVEDGSPDRTGEVADELAARHPTVRVIHHSKNMGYGAALRSGFLGATKEFVFYTDGDNQFDLQELKKFVALVPYTDIVSGFRIKKQYSTYRKLTSFVYNLVLRLLFDIQDRDVDCAFKLYRASIFDGMQLTSKGALIDVEIFARALRGGARIAEVGVHHYPRTAGRQTGANLSVIARAFRELFRLWREMRAPVA